MKMQAIISQTAWKQVRSKQLLITIPVLSGLRRFCQEAIRPVELSHHTYDGHDPPIIYLHGLFGSKANWQSVAKNINRKTNRKTILVDVRNHGDSNHSDVMSYAAMSTDLVAMMNKLRIDKAVLLGHSMGGKIAMVTALTQPERVDQLIAVDISPADSGGSTIDFSSYIGAMKKVKFDNSLPRSSMRKYADEQLQGVVKDLRDRQFLLTNLTEKYGHYYWRVNLTAVEKQLRSLYRFDHFKTVYDGPTLFIGGGKSPYISSKHYPEMRRLFPRSAVTHIEGAGHWVHSDKPAVFMDTLLKFLNRTLLPSHFYDSQANTGMHNMQIPFKVGS
ncbi:sn-1-specific diacylglycerol lipase ABHD11-like [Ptychodera flava]|uniref:sn-1-specific diacylglycerol lipase ABHD11-like n=1 Tax=Ptychodera flava TaxID=63121 RepID=UPI00396AB153